MDLSSRTIWVPPDALRDFVCYLFIKQGIDPASAETVARIIVLQEMRGIVTHGLRRVAPNLDGLKAGQINPAPRRRVLRNAGSVSVIDGDHGIGMLACMEAMHRA